MSTDLRLMLTGLTNLALSPLFAAGMCLDRVRLIGWTTLVTTYRFFRRCGLAEDFSGTSRDKCGPIGTHTTQNSLAFSFGQSVDIKLSENFAVRVQPDLVLVRRALLRGDPKVTLAMPLSFGVVYKFERS